MITTVVFDLDDTLYDEVEYCKSGFTAVADFLTEMPETPPAVRIFDALWKQFTTGNSTKTFNAALDELDIGYDDTEQWSEKIMEIVELVDIFLPNEKEATNYTREATAEAALKALAARGNTVVVKKGKNGSIA